jgi:hypothetical protein
MSKIHFGISFSLFVGVKFALVLGYHFDELPCFVEMGIFNEVINANFPSVEKGRHSFGEARKMPDHIFNVKDGVERNGFPTKNAYIVRVEVSKMDFFFWHKNYSCPHKKTMQASS